MISKFIESWKRTENFYVFIEFPKGETLRVLKQIVTQWNIILCRIHIFLLFWFWHLFQCHFVHWQFERRRKHEETENFLLVNEGFLDAFLAVSNITFYCLPLLLAFLCCFSQLKFMDFWKADNSVRSRYYSFRPNCIALSAVHSISNSFSVLIVFPIRWYQNLPLSTRVSSRVSHEFTTLLHFTLPTSLYWHFYRR